jgi:hypothetical protein
MMPGDVEEEDIYPRLRPTDMQLKQLVYRALTVESKAAFVAANQRLQDLTLHATVAYFDDLLSSQSMVAAATRSSGRNGNDNKGSNNNHDNNLDRKRHCGRSQRGNKGKQNGETCTHPKHQGIKHPWADCIFNKKSKNCKKQLSGGNAKDNQKGSSCVNEPPKDSKSPKLILMDGDKRNIRLRSIRT